MEKTADMHSVIAPPLTPRECGVLRLLAIGATDKAIADALGISPRTASHHVGSILRKLDVETRAGARRWAAGNGFAGMQPPLVTSLPAGAESAASPL